MGSVYKNYGDDIAPPPLSPNNGHHPWEGKPDASNTLQGKTVMMPRMIIDNTFS